MFDRPVIHVSPTRITREQVTEHVHEHRAPTDESVRLLAEMEAKARDKIIEAVHIGDTTFECVVQTMKNMHDDTICLIAVFSLNGKKLTVEHIERSDRFERRKAFQDLRDAMATKIATEILLPELDRLRIA